MLAVPGGLTYHNVTLLSSVFLTRFNRPLAHEHSQRELLQLQAEERHIKMHKHDEEVKKFHRRGREEVSHYKGRIAEPGAFCYIYWTSPASSPCVRVDILNLRLAEFQGSPRGAFTWMIRLTAAPRLLNEAGGRSASCFAVRRNFLPCFDVLGFYSTPRFFAGHHRLFIATPLSPWCGLLQSPLSPPPCSDSVA